MKSRIARPSALDIGRSWLQTKWSRAKTSCVGASSFTISINIWERDGKHQYCATNQNGNYVICLNCLCQSRKNTRRSGWEFGMRDLPAGSILHALLCPCRANLSHRLVDSLPFIFSLLQGSAGALECDKLLLFCKELMCASEESPEEAIAVNATGGDIFCDAGGEPCFRVEEPHVMLGFLKKSPHKNTGALCGVLYLWAGVTAVSVAWPTPPLVWEPSAVDR